MGKTTDKSVGMPVGMPEFMRLKRFGEKQSGVHEILDRYL